jgi:hypothetical protein
MKALVSSIFAAVGLVLLAGCTSNNVRVVGPAQKGERPPVKLFVESAKAATAIGQPIAPLVAAAQEAESRCEFFDSESKLVDELPVGSAGSVSIYLPENAGQDNYAFDAEGVVIRHQRSYGEDFTSGIWRDADK